jgi:hypothetical protein
MDEPGRDELIDAKSERTRLVEGMSVLGKAIERLMDDRVRHLAALRQIATMTGTGIAAIGGREINHIARKALRADDGQGED